MHKIKKKKFILCANKPLIDLNIIYFFSTSVLSCDCFFYMLFYFTCCEVLQFKNVS